MLLFVPAVGEAQQTPAPAKVVRPADSTRVRVLRISEEKIREGADRSLYYSLLVPGLGQTYNGELWKVPVIYASLLTVGSYIAFYDTLYQNARIAERRERDDFLRARNPLGRTGGSLMSHKEHMRRNRDLLIILGFSTYVLQAMEAHVSAYLRNFSVGEARVRIVPSVAPPQGTYGMRFLFEWDV